MTATGASHLSGGERNLASRNDNLAPVRESTRRRLNDVRRGLLHLHKVLLEIERRAYEQIHGRVTAGELLELLIGHERFAWLHAVSETVVRIDELLDGEEPVTEDEVQRLLVQVRSLLVPAEFGSGFARNYFLALQRDPAAVVAHGAVRTLLTAGVRDAT